MIALFIPGEPVAWARAGSNGTRRYTPPKQAAYKAEITLRARRAMAGLAPFDGPLALRVRVVYPVPASWSKAQRATAKWKVSKPDLDNLVKGVADALNGIVYRDDAQIAETVMQKCYGPIVGLTATIEPLD